MESKKYVIDGREYADFELSNEQLIDLIEGNTLMGSEKAVLKEKVIERFKHKCCKREGESGDELFARQFSDYVNSCPNDFEKAAKAMGRDHRYLQNEMFKLCLEYFKVLEQSYLNDRYDDRNRWAVKTANKALSLLRADNCPI